MLPSSVFHELFSSMNRNMHYIDFAGTTGSSLEAITLVAAVRSIFFCLTDHSESLGEFSLTVFPCPIYLCYKIGDLAPLYFDRISLTLREIVSARMLEIVIDTDVEIPDCRELRDCRGNKNVACPRTEQCFP